MEQMRMHIAHSLSAQQIGIPPKTAFQSLKVFTVRLCNTVVVADSKPHTQPVGRKLSCGSNEHLVEVVGQTNVILKDKE
jgi:hypothetical protein